MRPWLALSNPDKDSRAALLGLLELEKKAIRWYEAPARAYARSRAHLGAESGISAQTLAAEAAEWRTHWFGMPETANSAPREFIRLFEMERAAGGASGTAPARTPGAASAASGSPVREVGSSDSSMVLNGDVIPGVSELPIVISDDD